MRKPPTPEGAGGVLLVHHSRARTEVQDTTVTDQADIVRIPLGDSGHVAIVDAADADLVAPYRWYLLRTRKADRLYAHTRDGLYMHRLIAGTGPGLETDHQDGDGLNNRRANLRPATPSQNRANIGKRSGTSSRHKGVTWHPTRGKWQAKIHVNGRTRSLGRYLDEDDAGRAYDRAALAAWGEFARLNFAEVSA